MYSTLDDLKKKIDQTVLVQLTDTTASGGIDTAITDRAIREADAEIDSYAGKVYTVPLAPVPYVIVDVSAALAIAKLHEFRSVESDIWKSAQDRALRFLKDVATGAVTLEGVVSEPDQSPSSSISFDGPDKTFTREELKGF